MTSAPLPAYPRITDLGGGVTLIDTLHNGHPGTIGVFLLALPDGGHALVETGPGITIPEVSAGLTAAGASLTDLRYVLVTHIHLDHAGAAGAIARLSGAELIVHEVGAPHLIDPSRLMASATRVYGDALAGLWGTMEPAPAATVRAVAGGERLALGGLRVDVHYTPGHASHHVSYLTGDGTLFAGDVAGVLLAGCPIIRPALAPPELDLEAAENSLATLRALRPDRMLLTHFGPVPDVDAHLTAVAQRNRLWEAAVIAGLDAGEDQATLTRRLQALEDRELDEAGVAPGIAARYKQTSDAAMTVGGLSRYLTKFHPERLAAGRAEGEPGGGGVGSGGGDHGA